MRALCPILACVLLAACGKAPAPVTTETATGTAAAEGDPVEGLRVATRVGCNGCHAADGRGGGMDFTSPAGDRIVAPNLTERRERYDDAGLVALLREGRTHDGHRAFGMPIYMFQHLSDQEVRDITAWLRGLPSVANPGLAASTLSAATLKQIQDGTFPYDQDDRPDPGNRPPAMRPAGMLALGRHIALTSCGECHGRTLEGWGADDPAPSLVMVNKAYTPEKFARLMRTGEVAAGGTSKTGFMSETARRRYAHTLTDEEISALKHYLDSR
ncbi:c-type cytochrome [Pseudoxanthomonas sp. NC8]|nr:c-type cytochrome [Pseudoxanthomonas sp. NC8]